jgi:hypothetical protein
LDTHTPSRPLPRDAGEGTGGGLLHFKFVEA